MNLVNGVSVRRRAARALKEGFPKERRKKAAFDVSRERRGLRFGFNRTRHQGLLWDHGAV